MRTSIWLVRHGQTELNKARRYHGVTDSPLTSYGIEQARALALRLRRIRFTIAIVSPSDRERVMVTTLLTGRSVPIAEDPRWNETNHGRWEGLTFGEVQARFREEAVARFADGIHGRATDGESLAEVSRRVLAGWDALLRDHSGERILVVTHATPVQLVLCAVSSIPPELHWRWRIDLGSVTAFDVYDSGTIVRMVNEVPRLRQHYSKEQKS